MLSQGELPSLTMNAWQTLLNLMPNPVAILQRVPGVNKDNDALILVNKSYLETIGYPLEETPDLHTWFEKTCPDDDYRNLIINQWNAQLSANNDKTHNTLSVPCHLSCQDGEKRWLQISTHRHYPITDNLRLMVMLETSEPEEIIQSLQDTTKALQASNHELLKQKSLLKQTQELAKVGSWELDLKTGLINWSDEIYHMHGTEPGSFQPDLAYLLNVSTEAEDAKKLKNALETAILTGEKQHLTHKVKRRDGKTGIIELTGFIEYDEHNRPLKAVGSSTDITHALELQTQNNELAEIMERAYQEIFIYSTHNSRYLYANKDALESLGYTLEELQKMSIDQVYPHLTNGELEQYSIQAEKNPNQQKLLSQVRKNGTAYPVKANIQKVQFKGEEAIALFNRDISELKEVEETLREQNQLFENILQTVPTRIFWKDKNGDYLGANQHFLNDLKISSQDELRGKNDLEIEWPSGQGNTYFKQDMFVLNEGRSLLQLEDAFIDEDGSIQIWMMSKLPLRDETGKVTGLLGTYQDISSHRQLEIKLREQTQTLQHQAYHDALTQLPNRALLYQRIEQAIHRAERNNSQFAVLFIDLDHFKQINDSLGHDTGDQVLQAMARRLSDSLRKDDTISRLGGDEFTILQEPLNDYQDASALAQKLINATSQPLTIRDHTFYLSNSVGISIYPKDAITPDALLKAADAAMYRAKDQGRNNFQFYTNDLTEQAFEHLSMQTKIRQALDNEEFIPYFQPQINAQNGKLVGLEVLVRWKNKDGDIIPPSDFIPIAEKTGLIVQLDRQVMRKAIEHYTQWKKLGVIEGRLSLNLAVKQVQQKDFFTFIYNLLSKMQCEGSWLELELTESDIMTNLEEMSQKMNQLRELGIKISIDDFGTGYSSLSYLKKLPVRKLKIDRSFIRDLPDDEDDAVITKTIISMAENLGLEVIAEGVETVEQREFLLQNGCYQLQGFLYSKPLNATETLAYLRKL
ncbi:EAL domain-containing protein [Thiomicrorhabdus sp. 6S3-12]|uniref:EAL domain-containing protein n=1 Tax=Thiomicrorhabdus sp. 6S3-12 TaxID=2819681 RepID=UPI001AAE1165|nr:EAL domain-containing protein [Thiomicrorhabdus sp. 6S3-12]MBO1924600.1 EAL domain-containing protein [Thiomicrorhabdus sp. 6S3-12]